MSEAGPVFTVNPLCCLLLHPLKYDEGNVLQLRNAGFVVTFI